MLYRLTPSKVVLLSLLYMQLMDVFLIMNHQCIVMNHLKKDSQCSCNMTLKHVCETVVAMEKQRYKVRVQFTLEQAMKAQRGSRGIALLFL